MMSSKEAFEKADRVRREARKVRGKDPVIMVQPAIDDPDTVLADKNDNTVKVSVLRDPNAELAIIISPWLNLPAPSDGQDNLNVFHTIGAFEEEIYAGTFDQSNASDLPLRVVLDKTAAEYGADGTHSFYYEITSFYDQQTYRSDSVTLIFDRIAPNNGQAPEAVPAVPEVTDGNVASVGILLPDYPDRAGKDVVYFYWLDSVPENVEGVAPAGHAEVTAANQRLSVPETLIKAGGDGEWFVVYVLIDKAGNIGHVSKPTAAVVALGAMPANLKDPLVPLAADGMVDRLDAMLGVQVQVPEFDNWKATDEVSVAWGNSPLGRRTIGQGQTFPLFFNVSLEVLRREYGTPAQGTREITVEYEVLRGGKPRGDRNTTVDVNFETFGPVDPGTDPDPHWPDPVNPLLPLCTVYGEGSSQPNVLLPSHDGKDATLHVKLYEGLAENDLMDFFWEGTLIAEASYTVKATDNKDDPLVRTIPWRYIHATGNGAMDVHYQLTRVDVPNKPTSADQRVAVSAIVVHPDEPEFQGINNVGWLACQALVDPDNPQLPPAVRVKIGDLDQYGLKDGDKVTLNWKLLHAQTGNEEVLDWQQEVTLGTQYPVSGFIWRVEPYEDYILPLYDFDAVDHTGRAFCWYTFQDPLRRDQGLDALIVSDIAEQRIAMQTPFGPCDVFFKR